MDVKSNIYIQFFFFFFFKKLRFFLFLKQPGEKEREINKTQKNKLQGKVFVILNT
jgi:hypothetical protein